MKERHRAGTYIQTNNTPVHTSATQEGVEVMAVSQAMKKYDWLADYFWKAVAVDTDKYTANVELGQYDGYFFRALPGAKAEYPVQACLYLAQASSCGEQRERTDLEILRGKQYGANSLGPTRARLNKGGFTEESRPYYK
jgi:hypothetical protein